MKKKCLAILLSVCVVASFTGCGNNAGTDEVSVSADSAAVEESDDATAEDAAKEAEVEVKSLMGYNMIQNGDFTEDLNWFLYTNGGSGAINIADEALQADISTIGAVEHGYQIYYDGFSLEANCEYELQFDASSTVEREVEYRVQINGGDYHAYNMEVLQLTPETQHYDIKFTMKEATDPAPRLCFNMGLVNGTELGEHSVTFDNFELYCIDETNRVITDGSLVDCPSIYINQVGYLPDDTKTVVFSGDDLDDAFEVIDVKSGKSVYEGTLSTPAKNRNTNRIEAVGDFSSVTTPGTYKIVAEKTGESYEFEIANDVYDDVFKDAVRMLYLQRCGEITSDYAGDFAHGNCHSEKATVYGTSTKIDVSGGWHDAGDYGRYVVSGVKAVEDLFLAYENHPDVFGDDFDIPESGNGVPDVLDEARFELEWLMKMQKTDGSVYHKVTCAVFPGVCVPEEETDELIVAPVSDAATGDFAAIMAAASTLYADYDAHFADECLKAAKKAGDYLLTHDRIEGGFVNPEDIVTGEYPDAFVDDECLWAYAELYKATGDSKYSDAISMINLDSVKYGLGWADVGYYAAYAYLTCDETDATIAKTLKGKIDDGVDEIIVSIGKDNYKSSLFVNYFWGSNMGIANNGMLMTMVDALDGKDTNAKNAKAQLDYLLGANGNCYCFVTGYGSLSPESTHHRPSQVKGKTMVGMLVGGPDKFKEDPYAKASFKGRAEALCYVDNDQSYSCNEVTVYWNSPLIFLMSNYVD